MIKRQRRTNLIAIMVGGVATAAVVAAYLGGALDRLELITLDLRFRYTNSITAHPRIVCVDIDDDTLEVVGRWPWPRDRQAPLISIPARLGAEAILVDLTWSEPERVRSDDPQDADLLSDPLELDPETTERRYPDLELAATIAEAGNVYLVFDHPTRDPESSDEFTAAVDALRDGNESEARRQVEALLARRRAQSGTAEDEVDRDLFERARLVAALEARPTLSESQLADEPAVPPGDLAETWFDRCRVAAFERLTRSWLDAAPQRWRAEPVDLFAQYHQELTGRPPRGDTSFRRALALAFRRVLGYQATTRAAPLSLERIGPIATHIDGITPVYYLHARAARRCGFVNFEPDTDGVVRRVPLVARHGRRALMQIAFALACDALGAEGDDFEVAQRRLVLRKPEAPRGELSIQLDQRGRAMIPWVPGRDWVRTFAHLPADAIMSLHEREVALRHNQERIREALWLILSDQRFAELADQRKTIAGLFDLEAQIRQERYRGNAGDVRELTRLRDTLRPEIGKIERLVRQRIQALRRSSTEGSVADVDLEALTEPLQIIDDCHSANTNLRPEIDRIAARIRAIVAGKICLIGYTATSLPDMKPIPTSKSAAGVMAHANLLNGLLTGRLARWATPAKNALIAAAFGLLVSLLGAFMRPRLAALLVMFMAASFVALAGAVAFYKWTYWIALTPALGAMVFPFFGIALYRYVFIDSERRQLATALGQYTSKEMARQMADNPELCKRAEMREVTAVFTDLRGFTSIAERIGAQRTQTVLNITLGRFTEIMLRHEGMVNKFIGDGIFAFWNPVIYPQADHAVRACTAAVDLITGLEELTLEQRRRGGDAVFEELVLRIGIATGNAIVGPCGSEQKYDYTCIGDSVNVAARLESANKFYGTLILVSDATRAQVGQAFAFRPLGGVRVKGKRRAVPVHELLGRAGQVPDDALAYAGAFGQAVTLFQRRQWRAALEAFQDCQQRRPDDLAAENYVEATASLLVRPPGDDWSGAIELAEK